MKTKQHNKNLKNKVLSIEEARSYDFIPDDDFEIYDCHCRCGLENCDYDCWRYFVEQDYRPHRNPNLLKPDSKSSKIKSYNHFIKMLKKRNSKPYYFLRELFSKINFHARRLWLKYT